MLCFLFLFFIPSSQWRGVWTFFYIYCWTWRGLATCLSVCHHWSVISGVCLCPYLLVAKVDGSRFEMDGYLHTYHLVNHSLFSSSFTLFPIFYSLVAASYFPFFFFIHTHTPWNGLIMCCCIWVASLP